MSFTPWLSLIPVWAFPVVYLFAYIIVLVACIIGALHPTLRREFLWLAAAALLRCVASLVMLVPYLLRLGGITNFATADYATWYGLSTGIGLISLLLYVVGSILIAVRARSLPVLQR